MVLSAIRAFVNKRALRSSQEAGDLFLAHLCLLHFEGDPSVADEQGRLSTHARLSSLSLPNMRELVSGPAVRAAVSLCRPVAAALEKVSGSGFVAGQVPSLEALRLLRSAEVEGEGAGPPVTRAASTVEGAGDGLLATRDIRIGEPLALFPGTVYMLRDHAKVPRSEGDLVMMRYDESIIDASQVTPIAAAPRRQGAPISARLSRSLDDGNGDDDRLRLRPYLFEMPHGLGHLINHPPPGQPPNCLGISVDFPEDTALSIQSVLPNGYFRVPTFLDSPRWPRPLMRGYLFLAVSNIEKGQEVFIDYRFNPTGADLPDWYHPVDNDANNRRWGIE